ncbi:MAG TPA: SDR family NAD(P)-dependent oxidoreductase [Jiangellales bacterium]|nr:SDR family NAD(P)-dependent oxidoreductase [Jiangellales bacterium]
MSAFADRYGPWTLVAGASEGIGAAFARALAVRGLDLVLVARRAEPLAALAAELPTHAVTVPADLGTADGLDAVFAATEGREVGLVVANAAHAPVGPFVDTPAAELERALAVNCLAPLRLARHYLPVMAARGRGGLIVMSSLTGLQGSPGVTTYAATKAFGAVLAEGLWAEVRGSGVDVVACVAGAVATPGLARAIRRRAPGTVASEVVVEATLRALGRRPRVVPGALMNASAQLMTRLLPRRAAIALIGGASRDVLNPADSAPGRWAAEHSD